MFTVKTYRETTDGEQVKDTYEGVVDLKTNPLKPQARLTFKGERESETVQFENLHIESPLK